MSLNLPSSFQGFYRLFFTAVIAGCVGAVILTGLQWVKLLPLVEIAESYEGNLDVHFLPNVESDHHHNLIYVHGDTGHMHEDGGEWMPQDGTERLTYTFISNVVTGIAFSLLLCAAMIICKFRGLTITTSTGAVFGVLGFAVFHFAPAYSLPPILPGMSAAGFEFRQTIWIATLLCTLAGLSLFFLTRSTLLRASGVCVIVLPHLVFYNTIGTSLSLAGPSASFVPAEIAAAFVSASLATSLIFWLVLGSVSGRLLGHHTHTPEAA